MHKKVKVEILFFAALGGYHGFLFSAYVAVLPFLYAFIYYFLFRLYFLS